MKTLYYNGTVYTGDGITDGFAVEDGRFIDRDGGLDKDGYDECIDLEGRFVCAGFNDSHMHLINYGQSLGMARLNEHTASLQELISYGREFLKEHPLREGRWLQGRGFNQDYFSDGKRIPTADDLDRISADVPIIFTRACGHCCVVNSKALSIAGIGKDSTDPSGGRIGRDQNGEPNGQFYDNAIDLVRKALPLPLKEDLKEMILAACASLNAFGITSSQSDDYSVFTGLPYEAVNEAYEELISEGRLTVRVYEQSNFTNPKELKRFLAGGNLTGKGNALFRIGPLKMLGDGSLGSRTAFLSRPYDDDPNNCGFTLFSDEEMDQMIDLANRNGMQVAVHAIGDGCLDQVLNAIEKALNVHPRDDHRHGIVHCQISRADQLDRIARLKLHVYAQSVFFDYDNHIVIDRVGEELARTSYSWKTLMSKGVRVSNGSDAPVEIPDVLKGIECAVTRTSLDGTGPYLPEEAFTAAEALRSFTCEGAYASFEEKEKGLIKEGYLADFVILSEDPFNTEKKNIHKIKVLKTYLGGSCVFEI